MTSTVFVDGDLSPSNRIVAAWLNDVNEWTYDTSRYMMRMSQQVGADPNGATPNAAQVNGAIALSALLGVGLWIDGSYLCEQQIVIPAKACLRGMGWTSNSTRSRSCLIKGFDGAFTTPTSSAGFLFSGDDASSEGVHYDSLAGKTGDGVQVTGSRVRLSKGASTSHGRDGVRIGATETGPSSINANCGSMRDWISISNGRYGLNIDHTNTSTSGTYPVLGEPDANCWKFDHILLGSSGKGNGSSGLNVGNSIDCVFENIVSQANTGRSATFTDYSRGHVISLYSESNTGGGPQFSALSAGNDLYVTSTLITGNDPVDLNGTNKITRSSPSTGVGPFSNFLSAGDVTVGGKGRVRLIADVNFIEAAILTGSQPTGSRGRFGIETKANGGVSSERFYIDETGAVFYNIGAAGVLFNKTTADTSTPGVNIEGGAIGRIDLVNTGAATVAAFYSGGVQQGAITQSGTGTAAFVGTSDGRLKHKLIPLPDQGEFFDKVQVYEGEFIAHPGKRSPMFIAQELYPLAPEAVKVGGADPKEDPWGVDDGKLVRRLVREVQSLRERLAKAGL